jgi:fructose-specific phosphotransferase system IIB component
MAAEALEREAKRRGYSIKVETQGSMGLDNEISLKEAREADVVLFAVDMNVLKSERFSGKPLIKVGVAEAIRSPGKVIDMAVQKAEGKTD